ncbi:MAG: DUF1592 domain-containing protein [Bryobacteraceae bacterium]
MRPVLPIFLAVAATAADPTFDSTIAPFLVKNCIGCHNPKSKSGNLDLARLRDPATAAAERDAWETVARKLRRSEMPPAPLPKPPAADIAAVIDWSEKQVAAIDKTRKIDPGRVTARRLNRAEYNNTIRDLTGVTFRPADDFPLDDSGYGFDNIGDVLSINPGLMEKYLHAADQVVRAAIVTGSNPKAIYERYELERLGEPSQVPADPEAERLVKRGSLIARHRFPIDAEYELRVQIRGRGKEGDAPAKLILFAAGRQLQTFDVEPGQNKKRAFEHKLRMPPGEVEVGASWIYPGPAFDAAKKEDGAGTNLWVDAVEVRGPYALQQAGLPESHRRIFVCTPAPGQFDRDCARRIVAGFTRRAWRRPVTPSEIEKLLGFVDMAKKEGDTFEQAIQLALKAVLVSPNFLFRMERDPAAGAAPRELNDIELASRLSYFLWSSMPDEELLRAAEAGQLHQPAAIDAQVKRMLADPKSAALADNFAGQWLELRNLNQVSPDPKKFPDYDSDFREAMRRETQLFFQTLVKEDRPILDFIDGRYTFLNERLAKHYGIAGVTGRKFQRVELDGAQRSGVLTQASVLTISSHPNRTSPVLRGLWILDNFLATPPPAPPANVPQLKEEEIGVTMSLRKQMERHRADPNCAVCHAKIDPLGFGLENYDPLGTWRTHDGKFEVEAGGVLPGERKFASPAELKQLLLQDKDTFTRGLAEKMLTYALGRGLEPYDKPVVRSMTENVAAKGYRFSSMIQEIVQSPPFRMRRGDGGKRI